MAPKIFLYVNTTSYCHFLTVDRTGGTGYIGGSVLHTIVTNHPEYEVTVLLRSIPEKFATTYPQVQIVRGDYDSIDTLVEAASEADVVVRESTESSSP